MRDNRLMDKPVCGIGYGCKYACINQAKNCLNGLEGEGGERVQYLKDHSSPVTQTEFFASWGKAYKNAPDDLKAAIAKLPQPEQDMRSANGVAGYFPDSNSITMADYTTKTPGSRSVFTHEHGHFIDFNADQSLGDRESIAFEKGRGLFDKDARDIMDKEGSARNELLKTLRNEPELDGLYGEDRLWGAYQALDRKIGEDVSKRIPDYDRLTPEKQQFRLEEEYEKLAFEELPEGSVLRLAFEYRTLEEDYSPLIDAGNVLMAHRSGELSRKLAVVGEALQDDMAVQDLFGSLTVNQVGEGHSPEYYRSSPERKYTEAFANINALYSSGDELAIRLLEEETPNSFKFYRRVLDDIGKR